MIQQIKTRFEKIKPHIPTVCFICGSVWDTLTLKRIDNALDLFIFSGYLLLSSVIVILIGRKATFKFSEHLPAAAQFFFGGLFSASTVYYFKSTSSLPTFLFLLGIAGLLVGNEFLEKRYSSAQIAFTLWSICAFMILNFLIPVLLHHMNVFVFLLSVATAFSLCFLIRKLASNGSLSLKPVAAIYGLLIILYFLNVIPPVPLSKKDMGIYRSVQKQGTTYVCTMEQPGWFEPFRRGEKVYRFRPGDAVYCYSSIFAPTRLRKKIYHHWYYKNPRTGKTEERGKFGYELTGGRSEGYRGYTYKRTVEPGKWHVRLKTDDGKTIGIVKFRIEKDDSPVAPVIKTVHN